MSCGTGGHCRKCRYSEGAAVCRNGRWRLVLWCQVSGLRARRVCKHYHPMDSER